MATCKNCKFVASAAKTGPVIVGQKEQLECRRFPPVAHPMMNPSGGVAFITVYPPVPTDFPACGEFAIGFQTPVQG